MTKTEAAQIERLTGVVAELQVQIATLTERIEGLCELRNSQDALAASRLRSLEERCNERHGELARRVKELESEERTTYGWRERLAGMGVPVAICVSIVAVVLGALR